MGRGSKKKKMVEFKFGICHWNVGDCWKNNEVMNVISVALLLRLCTNLHDLYMAQKHVLRSNRGGIE